MNCLYSIGCSHSNRIYFNNDLYCKPYNEYLTEYLNLGFINLSQNASGNDFILNSFINIIDKLHSTDIVLIQLTHFHRNNFYDVNQKEKVFGSYHIRNGATDWNNPINIAWHSIFEYIYPQTIINLFDLIEIVKKTIGCRIYLFSIEEWRHSFQNGNGEYQFWLNPYLNNKSLILFGDEKFKSLGEYSMKYNLLSLKDAGEYEDGHMSSESHKIVANLIHKYIKENE